MKRITLQCPDCNKVLTLTGKTLEGIIKKLEKSGWHDFPTARGIAAHCPQHDEICESDHFDD